MDSMFNGCSNLRYINLKNVIENDYLSVNSIFDEVPENVLVCLNNNSEKIKSKILEKSCYSSSCSDQWETEQKTIVNKNGICIDNSGNDISFNYEYKGKYYQDCSNGDLTINSEIQSCQCDTEKCLTCPNEPLVEDLCIECNNSYYPIENDNYTHIEGYVKCYKDPNGYYLDKNESIYKKCYYSCKECEQMGDNIIHNCLICNDNYPYIISKNNYSNCYDNDSYYNYLTEENPLISTFITNYIINSTFLDESTELLIQTKEIIKSNELKNLTENAISFDNNETESLTENLTKFGYNEIKKLIENIASNETVKKTKEEEIEYYDTILDIIETGFTSGNYDTTELDNGGVEIIKTEKMTITFTTIQNQKNVINDNMTNINLGECEILLGRLYNLTNNETLYLKILEIIQEGMKIPKVEFDIYCKLFGSNLTKLNLSVCYNTKISLSIPVKINDNLDVLNSSSGYYNDICYTATTESGTDITLKDRKKEYVNNTVCQDDCDFLEYNYTSQKAKCSCKVKESSSSFADMKIDKDKLLSNFKNIKNVANLNILVCIKRLFSKIGILENIGFYIFIAIIIFRIISLFVFYIRQLNSLQKKIKYISYAIKHLELLIKEEEKNKSKNEENKNDKIEIKLDKINNINNNPDNNINNIDINNDIKNSNINEERENKINYRKTRKVLKKKKRKSMFIKKGKESEFQLNIGNTENIVNNNIINNYIINNNIINNNIINNNIINKNIDNIYDKLFIRNDDDNNLMNINSNKKNDYLKNERKINHIITTNNISEEKQPKLSKQKKIEILKRIMDYTDDEKNEFPYNLAIQYDKRTYCQYYISLIKTKHNLFFSFYYNKDYNSRIIKMDLFFIGLATNYTMNALFYNDDTMHNIYASNGSFDLEYQLPKIIYSSLISLIIDTLMKKLALSNDEILDFKKNKKRLNINNRKKKLFSKLSIKFILYFIISFIFLIFFWYYISMFGAIYTNTQFHLFKDTIISFALSFIYPFVIYLIPGFFRIYSLSDPQKKREYLYKFSKIFHIL